jgi:hypothetical protein
MLFITTVKIKVKENSIDLKTKRKRSNACKNSNI